MFLLDRFFDGTFLTFGIEVISFADRDQEDRIDPMVYIFPRYPNFQTVLIFSHGSNLTTSITITCVQHARDCQVKQR